MAKRKWLNSKSSGGAMQYKGNETKWLIAILLIVVVLAFVGWATWYWGFRESLLADQVLSEVYDPSNEQFLVANQSADINRIADPELASIGVPISSNPLTQGYHPEAYVEDGDPGGNSVSAFLEA